MSQLRVESQVNADSWNAALRTVNGTVFHTPEWARCVKAEERGTRAEFYSLVDDDGSLQGLALGFRSSSSRAVAASFTGRRWLDSLPAVKNDSPELVTRFLELIENHSRRNGDVTLEIGSFASPGTSEILSARNFSLSRRLEFELDLTTLTEDGWLERMDRQRRQRIKKAMRLNIEVRELPPEEGVSHLRRLQRESFVRIVERGGPALAKLETDEDPTSALTASGLGRVVGAFVDGACVSASFFTTFNGLAYHALSGHDAKALETQAPSLVLWEMALRFKSEGMTRLNFGGCGIDALEAASPEHGVYAYKRAFGGVQLNCASGQKILRPAVKRMANFLRAAVG